jgi:hypothetical protein
MYQEDFSFHLAILLVFVPVPELQSSALKRLLVAKLTREGNTKLLAISKNETHF